MRRRTRSTARVRRRLEELSNVARKRSFGISRRYPRRSKLADSLLPSDFHYDTAFYFKMDFDLEELVHVEQTCEYSSHNFCE